MTSASQSQSPNFIVLLANDLQSKQRSPFDAFVYVNRIPLSPESDETQEDLAGRILGRLANQEGRVLVKLPPGMNRMAFDGFKIVLGSESHQDFLLQIFNKPKLLRGFAALFACLLCVASLGSEPTDHSIRGRVVDSAGSGIEGVMVSAIDDEQRKWTSVFTQQDGSYAIDGLRSVEHNIRTRLMGLADEYRSSVNPGVAAMVIETGPAGGAELELQRPADSAFSMLSFDDPRDKLNFKMNCAYCHQIGTVGFRTPEEPVDWETMLRRMDGFGGLYPHTQKTIIGRLMNTYKDDAVDKWPTFVPPPAPTGMAAVATICRNIDTDVWDSYGPSSFG